MSEKPADFDLSRPCPNGRIIVDITPSEVRFRPSPRDVSRVWWKFWAFLTVLFGFPIAVVILAVRKFSGESIRKRISCPSKVLDEPKALATGTFQEKTVVGAFGSFNRWNTNQGN